MILEIVTQTADETQLVKDLGADRVELVSGITEGALTPTYGSLIGVYHDVKLPAFCMYRPHNHGFVYTDADISEMMEDIKNQRNCASSIVLGCLTQDDQIDEENLVKLLSVCGNVPVTFHMAIQRTRDYEEGLKVISKYPQITRILTNFKIRDVENNIELIKEKNQFCKELGLEVTFAGGVNVESMPFLKKAGISACHVSSSARIDGLAKNKLDVEIIKRMVAACH